MHFSIGWVLRGTLTATSSFISSCSKVVAESETDMKKIYELLKPWYEAESDGAFKGFQPGSVSDHRAFEILEKTTLDDGARCQVGMP